MVDGKDIGALEQKLAELPDMKDKLPQTVYLARLAEYHANLYGLKALKATQE
jgi:hypothetical protein